MEFAGVIPPAVTPFDSNEDLDERSLRGEVEYLIAAGASGICVTGSTGEGATLTLAESARVARIVSDQARHRVPIISGIIQNSTRVVQEFAQASQAAGVDALQVTPVHYLFAPDAGGTVDFYRAIARQIPLPIFIYNVIPWASLDPATLVRVMHEVSHVIGVKQSGGDMHKLADLLTMVSPEHLVFTAIDDLLYPSFVLGVHGTIAGIATAIPRTVVELWDAVQRADHAKALQLHRIALQMWRAIEGSNMPAKMKLALQLQNRSSGVARSPYAAITEEQRQAIERAVELARPYEAGV